VEANSKGVSHGEFCQRVLDLRMKTGTDMRRHRVGRRPKSAVNKSCDNSKDTK
jgi:hypothetical protein